MLKNFPEMRFPNARPPMRGSAVRQSAGTPAENNPFVTKSR